jgi:hypothetical protein
MTNTDLRTFKAIVPTRLASQPASEQYSNETPAAYKAFGAVGLSPIKVQHLMDSLIGNLATATARAVDQVIGDEGTGEKPELTLDRTPLLSSVIQNPHSSEAKEWLYELAAKSGEVKRALNDKKNSGAPVEEIKQFVEDHRLELSMADAASAYVKKMGELNKAVRVIKNDAKRTGAQKTDDIKRIQDAQDRVAEQSKGVYGANQFGPEAWAQLMNVQTPMMQNMMNSYVEQSKNLFEQMQDKVQDQARSMFSTFPFPTPGAPDKGK